MVFKKNYFITLLLLILCVVPIWAISDAVEFPLVQGRATGVAGAEQGADYFEKWFLASKYKSPEHSLYVLIPRKGENDCDILRKSYRVNGKLITISQTFFMMHCQINRTLYTGHELLPVVEVKTLMQQLFQNIDINPRFMILNHSTLTREPATDPRGTGTTWWQKPGFIGFYQIKDDGKVSSLVPTLRLAANARWFTPRQPDEQTLGFIEKSVSRQTILDQLVVDPDPLSVVELRRNSASWVQQSLTYQYQPPEGLDYVTLPPERFGGLMALQMRYEAEKKVITVTQAPTLAIVQIEEPGFDERPPLSDEETQTLAGQIFKNAKGIKILTTSATATTAEGIVRVKAGSHAAWMNGMRWRQDSGRVIFHLKRQ